MERATPNSPVSKAIAIIFRQANDIKVSAEARCHSADSDNFDDFDDMNIYSTAASNTRDIARMQHYSAIAEKYPELALPATQAALYTAIILLANSDNELAVAALIEPILQHVRVTVDAAVAAAEAE
jgi:hypothetical protein